MDESSFERLLNIQSYTDEELKSLLSRLEAEEREISMRRRVLHGEMDIVRAEMVRRLRTRSQDGDLVVGGDIAALSEILSGHQHFAEALGADPGKETPGEGERP